MRLGIRPEFLEVDPPEGWATIEGRIEVVEHLGAETIVSLSTSGPEVTARVKRNDALHHGMTTRIGADPSHVLAFDSGSGDRLRA